jgi:cell division protein FtsW (lipid II flippase)
MPTMRHPGELRWETRLLALVTMLLLAIGLVSIYGATSVVGRSSQHFGAGLALRQLAGALVGGSGRGPHWASPSSCS